MNDTLDKLFTIIEGRKSAQAEASYTAKLFAKGRDKIAQKVGEEAVETVIEGVRGDKKKLAEESADLLYHLLVLWADCGIAPADVTAVIKERMLAPVGDKKARKGGDLKNIPPPSGKGNSDVPTAPARPAAPLAARPASSACPVKSSRASAG